MKARPRWASCADEVLGRRDGFRPRQAHAHQRPTAAGTLGGNTPAMLAHDGWRRSA